MSKKQKFTGQCAIALPPLCAAQGALVNWITIVYNYLINFFENPKSLSLQQVFLTVRTHYSRSLRVLKILFSRILLSEISALPVVLFGVIRLLQIQLPSFNVWPDSKIVHQDLPLPCPSPWAPPLFRTLPEVVPTNPFS